MERRPLRPILIGLALTLLLVGCGTDDVVDAGPVRGEPATSGGDDTPDDAPASDTSDDADDADEGDDADVGEEGDEGDDDSQSDADGDEPVTAVRLYYLAPGGDTPARAGPFLVSVHREIASTPRIAHATLRALVEGPSAADEELIDDVSTAVPTSTLVVGVAIDDAVATVNLSREFESGGGSFSMLARLGQIVYTLTQFPTVDAVQFELDGQPVTVFSGEGIVLDEPVSREDYLDLLPTVFVDVPAAGAELSDGARVRGMAAVFEATFQYRLEAADGTVLAEDFEMTDNGMGWGTFDFAIDVSVEEEQPGRLTVWEYSAKDGSVQAERTTPVTLVP